MDEMPTSKRVAKLASKELKAQTTKKEKAVAASALSQAKGKKKVRRTK